MNTIIQEMFLEYKDHDLLLSFLNTDYDLNLKEDFLRLFQTIYLIYPKKYSYIYCLQVEDRQLFMNELFDYFFSFEVDIILTLKFIKRGNCSMRLWVKIMKSIPLNNRYTLLRKLYYDECEFGDVNDDFFKTDDFTLNENKYFFVILDIFNSKSNRNFYLYLSRDYYSKYTLIKLSDQFDDIIPKTKFNQKYNDYFLKQNIAPHEPLFLEYLFGW